MRLDTDHPRLDDAPPPGATLIVGASGGVDSQSLAHWLAHAHQRWRLVLAHLHHGLRGAEADADAALVEGTASALGAAFERRDVDVAALALQRRQGIEEAGRRARRELFNDMVHAHGASAIVTAHHADDQAETVWMNLQRGAGLRGMAGMRVWSGNHWRPWLGIRRAAVLEYAGTHGIAHRADASNADLRFARNRVRAFFASERAAGRDPVPRLLAMSAEARALDTTLEAWLDSVWEYWSEHDAGAVSLERERLLTLDDERRARLLMRAFAATGQPEGGLYRVHLDALQRLLESPRPNAQLNLPNGVVASREGGLLVIGPPSAQISPWALEVTGEGAGSTPAGHFRWRRGEARILSGQLCVDARRAGGAARLRSARPGDRFQPLGMPGEKKVARFLMDAKATARARQRTAVLESEGRILGVLAPGLPPRPDAHAALGAGSGHMLAIEAVQT